MLLSEPTQPVVCSVVDNMLPLFFESWPSQVPPNFFFFILQKSWLQSVVENTKIMVAVVNL